MRYLLLLIIIIFNVSATAQQPFVQVLGVAQDGGYPHAGCTKTCCTNAWEHPDARRFVVSLALVDPATKKWWLFEATPDIKEQLQYFHTLTRGAYNYLPAGIFITHAHIGHYTGLMQLGREVMSTKQMPVYTLPKLKNFLETNGPWSQLVTLHNILPVVMDTNVAIQLTNNISVAVFTVPHRDEFSETAGFRINTGAKKYLFIPDINKWQVWHKRLIDEIAKVDIAFTDATFYDSLELPPAARGVVLHPFVTETTALLHNVSGKEKNKLYLIHFNHTNPLLWDDGKRKEIERRGFHVARQGQVL